MGNKVIDIRRAVYRWLYERRVDSPQLYFAAPELQAVGRDPELTAALIFGLEMGHLEKRRGHWRLTAQGMLFAETENYVEASD